MVCKNNNFFFSFCNLFRLIKQGKPSPKIFEKRKIKFRLKLISKKKDSLIYQKTTVKTFICKKTSLMQQRIKFKTDSRCAILANLASYFTLIKKKHFQ